MMRTHAAFFFLTLVCVGLFGRLILHLPNATPITAIALTAGIYLGWRFALLAPLLALFISDMLIGFYDVGIMLSVYGSFAVIGLLSGMYARRNKFRESALIVLGSSMFFFLTTNFAVWLFSPWYAKTLEGLLLSYTLGLPFMRNMLIGDVAYSVALVSVIETAIFFLARGALTKKRREISSVGGCVP